MHFEILGIMEFGDCHLCHYISFDINVVHSGLLIQFYWSLWFLLLGVCLCRFTSDVKLKSISIVGGADGTSPAKMRAWVLTTDILFILLYINISHLSPYLCCCRRGPFGVMYFAHFILHILLTSPILFCRLVNISCSLQIHQPGWYWFFRCSEHATCSGVCVCVHPVFLEEFYS